jgi:hypothetical protein
MVQALAFAEIFGGLIIMYAGYKGRSISEVVKGEVTKESAAEPLGAEGVTGSANAAGEPTPAGVTGGAQAGAPTGLLTWKSLEAQIKAHKLTPAQVTKDINLLNNPPAAK